MKTIIFINGEHLTIEPEQYIDLEYILEKSLVPTFVTLKHETGTEKVVNTSQILYIK
jgi:hypothetical protein